MYSFILPSDRGIAQIVIFFSLKFSIVIRVITVLYYSVCARTMARTHFFGFVVECKHSGLGLLHQLKRNLPEIIVMFC